MTAFVNEALESVTTHLVCQGHRRHWLRLSPGYPLNHRDTVDNPHFFVAISEVTGAVQTDRSNHKQDGDIFLVLREMIIPAKLGTTWAALDASSSSSNLTRYSSGPKSPPSTTSENEEGYLLRLQFSTTIPEAAT